MEAPALRSPDGLLCGPCGYELRGLPAAGGVVRCPECGIVAATLAEPPGIGWVRTFAGWSCVTILICGWHLIAKGMDPSMDRYGVMTRDVYEWALFTAPLAPVVLGSWLASVDAEPAVKQRLFRGSVVWGTLTNSLLVFVSAVVQPPGPFAIAC